MVDPASPAEASADLFRTLVEHTPDMVVRFDREGRHLYVNPAVVLATGILQEEFLGRTHAELGMPAKQVALWREVLPRVFRTAQQSTLEFEFLAQGGRREFEARLVPEISPAGVVESVVAVVRDVTQQKLAEQERERLVRTLEAERVRLAEMVLHAPAFIGTLRGPEHVFELANTDSYQLVGHRALIGRSVRDALPELVEQGFVELLDRVYTTGEPYRGIEVPIRVGHGAGSPREQRYVDFVYQPLRERGGSVSGIFFHAVDVTRSVEARLEAERAAQALRVSEARYRRLVEASPSGIFATDALGRFIEANPSLGEILQRDPADLLGRHYAEFVSPPDLERLRALSRQGQSGELGTRELEFRVTLPSGATRIVHVRAAPVVDDSRRVGSHGVVSDVTEERGREERIHLLGTALESLSEGVLVVRPDGVLVYANPAYARIMAFEPDRLAEQRLQNFALDEEGREEIEAIVQTVLRTGGWAGRVRRRRADGEPVDLDYLISRVTDAGDEILLAIVRDISDELVRERHLRRTERMASVGTLLSGVAHELNNPLHAITNFAHLMLMDPRSPDDQEALEIIRREADRAAKIVTDLRSVARQTQEETAERDLVDLNEVVGHVLKLRRYTHQTHNVRVEARLAGNLPPVSADRGELEQVLLNLVLNAEQAMTGLEGEHRLMIRTSRSRTGACLVVTDTGPGIAARHLEHIFDPFFTTKPPGEGTGLGLSLAYGIVTEHGGTIRVESRPGEGAAFTVELPVAVDPDAREARVEAPPPGPPARALRILVVDDESAIRRSLARFLSRRGHQVDEAAEGEQALALLARHGVDDYDVVLSDLRMPGLDGEHLLARLRELGGALHERVVFMTGDAANAGAARLAAGGRRPVLVKPVAPDEVARVVERHAERTSHQREET